MTRKRIFLYELIGKEVIVIDSPNSSIKGIMGKVIDETKETLKIRTSNNKEVTLLKKAITFKLLRDGVIIHGKEITTRPEDRLKSR